MQNALTGALVGLGIGLLIFIGDYMVLRSAVKERFKRTKRQGEMNPTERKRIRSLGMFCVLVLPPMFAFIFWAFVS